MPPGIIPLRCLPGQKILLPFAGFLSPPHFLWSPPEVRENTIGLHPVVEKHEPAIFDIEPLTGLTIKGRFRMQLSIPIYTNPFYTETRQLVNSFIPSFWVGIDLVIRDYAHDYIYFNTNELPRIVLGVGLGLVLVPPIVSLSWIFTVIKRKRMNYSYRL
uniref:Protein PBN1 n=1 Tax=Angiostrongylus cantonensis TaxID=6313 RepID=A0A0K0D445_ANGCA